MALNIKDTETDRLARELAAETGESITVAARKAIEERLERVRSAGTAGPALREVARIQRRIAELPVRDRRPADEIIGYDESGAPR